MAVGVKEKLAEIIGMHCGSGDDGETRQWFERSMQGRYTTDIFE